MHLSDIIDPHQLFCFLHFSWDISAISHGGVKTLIPSTNTALDVVATLSRMYVGKNTCCHLENVVEKRVESM